MKTIKWLRLHYPVFYWQKNQTAKQYSAKKIWVRLRQRIGKSLDNWWQRLTTADTFLAKPKIRSKKDRFGNTYFIVYDPIRDRTIYLNSEDEVRWWLDKRYYL